MRLDFDVPSTEAMLVQVLLDIRPDWTPEQFEDVRRAYFKARGSKNGYNFGAMLDAAVTLFSAEIHRAQGQDARPRELVSEAVADVPGHKPLLQFEASLSQEPLVRILWPKLLLRGSGEG